MLEVVHCNTQKQLADGLAKAIKTNQFLCLRDGIDVVSFGEAAYELKDDVRINSFFINL